MRYSVALLALLIPASSDAADVQIIQNGKVLYNCTAPGTNPPKPNPPKPNPPPSNCQSTMPYDVRDLPHGTNRIAITANRAIAYTFNSRDLRDTQGLFSYAGEHAPGASQPSPKTALSVGTCPGQFDFHAQGYPCVSNGKEGSIRYHVTTNNTSRCQLKPNTTYYLNASPWHVSKKQATCSNRCGIALQTPKLK